MDRTAGKTKTCRSIFIHESFLNRFILIISALDCNWILKKKKKQRKAFTVALLHISVPPLHSLSCGGVFLEGANFLLLKAASLFSVIWTVSLIVATLSVTTHSSSSPSCDTLWYKRHLSHTFLATALNGPVFAYAPLQHGTQLSFNISMMQHHKWRK